MIRIAGGEPLRIRQQDVVSDAATPSSAASTPRTRQRNFMPGPGHGQPTSRCPAGPGVRFDTMLYPGLHGAALLRLAARQADRLGRRPRASALARLRARARRAADRAASRRPCRCIRRSPTTPTCRPGDFHTRWLEDWLRDANSPRRRASAKEVAAMKNRYSFGGDEHIFVEVRRGACRSRPSSRACR